MVNLYFYIDPQITAIKMRLSIVHVALQGVPKSYQLKDEKRLSNTIGIVESFIAEKVSFAKY